MEMSIFLIILKAKQGILTFSLLQFSGCNSTVESTWINCRKEARKIATSPRNRLIANQLFLSIHFHPTRFVKKYRKHCFGKYFLNILLFKLKQLEKFARTFFFILCRRMIMKCKGFRKGLAIFWCFVNGGVLAYRCSL